MMKLENQNHSFSLQHTQVSHITYTGHLSTKRGQWDLAQAAASEPDLSAAHTHTHTHLTFLLPALLCRISSRMDGAG